jgi:hypothetical protein
LGAIVRMQMILRAGRGRVSCIERVRVREIAQARGKERNRGALTAAEEKISAAGIEGMEGRGMKAERASRVFWPTQSDVPWKFPGESVSDYMRTRDGGGSGR